MLLSILFSDTLQPSRLGAQAPRTPICYLAKTSPGTARLQLPNAPEIVGSLLRTSRASLRRSISDALFSLDSKRIDAGLSTISAVCPRRADRLPLLPIRLLRDIVLLLIFVRR